MVEITQDTIFEIAFNIEANSGFRNTGHFDAHELAEKFRDEEAIEVYINFYGGSHVAAEFNWWPSSIDRLVEVYGERLRSICTHRMANPLHSGGTAYGEAYLNRSKELCKQYCYLVLETLNGNLP